MSDYYAKQRQNEMSLLAIKNYRKIVIKYKYNFNPRS